MSVRFSCRKIKYSQSREKIFARVESGKVESFYNIDL